MAIQPDLVAWGGPDLLRAMMENLLGNAWKFTKLREGAQIEFGQEPVAGKSGFFVRDNGAGFEMATAAKLFQPFQRLHREAEFPGSGVGLATVKRIIEGHGGIVRAESVAGEGTTVHFTLGGPAGNGQ